MTSFADAAVIVPLSITVALILLLLGHGRTALVWSCASVFVWATMLVLKLTGYTLEQVAPAISLQWGLVTASGHVAAAATAYGALAGLLTGARDTAIWRAFLVALGTAIVIGATRILLHDHTLAEALLGALVGVSGATAIAALNRDRIGGRPRQALLAAATIVIIVLHGSHVTWERSIAAASDRVAQTLRSATATPTVIR